MDKNYRRNQPQWIAGKYEFTKDRGYGISIGSNANGNLGQVAIGGRDLTGVYHTSGFSYDTVNDGQWHCIVGTVGNGFWSIYIDGVLQNSAAGSSNVLASSDSVPFTVGSYLGTNPGTPLRMNGDIDNVIVYNRVLSQKEIDCLCPGNLPLGNSCICGSFSNLSLRLHQGAPNQTVNCGDTIPLNCPFVFQFGGEFHCQGQACERDVMDWKLDGPGGIDSSGTLFAASFGLPLDANNFSLPGLYTLTLVGYCNGQSCPPCKIYFEVNKCPDPCDSLKVMPHLVNNPTMEGRCCYSVAIKNTLPSPALNKICVNLTSTDWIFEPGSIIAGGWNIVPNGTNQFCLTYTWGGATAIPVGILLWNEFIFCLEPTSQNASATQQLVFDWYNGSQLVCKDSMLFDCTATYKKGCCRDSTAFFSAAAQFQSNGTLGDCTLFVNGTGLDSCKQVTWSWGDNQTTGPVGNATSVSHVYSGTGTYNVCHLIEELDSNGNVCWSYKKCDSVYVICDSCMCGSFTNLSARINIGQQNLSIDCGKTYTLNCPSVFQFGGDFACQGNGCDSTTKVEWSINGPIGGGGTVSANTGFTLPLNAQSFSINGLYKLTLVGYCDGKPCSPCIIYFEVTGCSTCCKDSVSFSNAVANFQTNGALGNCTIFQNGTGLDSCMQVTWLWGDGDTTGPVGNATPVSHIYSGTGTYNVCYIIEALDNGEVCWSHKKCDSIYISCGACDLVSLSVIPSSQNGDTCCYKLYLNNTNGPLITNINISAQSPVNFIGASPAPGWQVGPGPSLLQWALASGGTVPSGNNILMGTFCLKGSGQSPQSLAVQFLEFVGPNKFNLHCVDTVFTECHVNNCVCGSFNNLSARLNIGQQNLNIECGKTYTLNCPTVFQFGGEFACQGNDCDSTTKVEWNINGPIGGGGTVLASPGFTLPLTAASFALPGLYTLTLVGYCDGKPCPPCIIYFESKGCDSCICGSFTNMSARINIGQQNVNIDCNKTYMLDCPPVFQFGGDFNCKGNDCDSVTKVEWNINGPIGGGGTVLASHGFTLPLTAASFSLPGLYTLTLVGYCDGKPCPPCIIYFESKGCKGCCRDSTAFFNTVANFQNNGALGDCKIFMNGTGLDSCMQVTWSWGDNTTTGPVGNAISVSHTYSGTGTYNVCYLIEEKDANGKVCWSFKKCDSVYVICDSCCKDKDIFCQNVMKAVTITIDSAICKVTLNISDLPPCDYIEYIHWGDSSRSKINFIGTATNPTATRQSAMSMHTYTQSGTYIISFLAVEIDPLTGFICFEKIIKDTITVNCGPCTNNLVPNPSFEVYDSCPSGLAPPFTASVWTLPSAGSADYYNSCASAGSGVSTPGNTFGTQVPHTGSGYAGFILRPTINYREYLEVPLLSPLVAGCNYQVSFYVSLADEARWAIDKFGAYLSIGAVGPVPLAPAFTLLTPQVNNPLGNFVTDKIGWTLISGTYLATGGEDHLVVGNFYDNTGTIPITGLGGFYPGSYYYIDDVSVCSGCPSQTIDSTCCADSTVFAALINQGFTITQSDCKVTVTAPQFDSCYYFGTPPILDGEIGLQVITDPSGSWMYNFTQSGTHQVCVTVYDECNRGQMCTTFKVKCDTCECGPADHLSFGGHGFTTAAAYGRPTPVELPCNAGGQLFYFHGNISCKGDSCLEDKFNWQIKDSMGVHIAGGSDLVHIFSGNNANIGHFDVNNLNPALFTPGVVYTITIGWYCGGKLCTCEIKFLIKDCDDCKCGKFSNVFLRPIHGAPSIPVSCDVDSKPPTIPCPVPGQPFNIAGQFMCAGDSCSSNTLIKWVLIDPMGQIIDSGFTSASPGFSFNLTAKHFGKAGVYCIRLTGHCGKQLCTCVIKFNIKEACPCDDCMCGEFSDMFIRSGQGPSQPILCSDDSTSSIRRFIYNSCEECNSVCPGVCFLTGGGQYCQCFLEHIRTSNGVKIPCPPNGQDIVITGKVACMGIDCPKTTLMDWVLLDPNGLPIASTNNVIATPNFTVHLSPLLLTQPNDYTLQLISHCGSNECICEIKFQMEAPCPDKCECDKFSILSSVGHGPILPKNCGDTIYVADSLPLFFASAFNCKGVCPPYPPVVSWSLTGPLGFKPHGGIVSATPNLYLGIDESTFTIPGVYTLTLIGHCGNKECICKITFIKQNDCCKDQEIFEQHMLSAISVLSDPTKCKVTVQIGKLPACDYIEKINWGDGTISIGPFVTGDIPMHTYITSGTYSISIIAVEEDPAMDMYCFVKLIKETVKLNCGVIGNLKSNERITVQNIIRIFPNPNFGAFIVDLLEPAKAGTILRVVTLTGQIMLDLLAKTSTQEQEVIVTTLPPGLYFMQVYSEGKLIAVEKFIKQ